MLLSNPNTWIVALAALAAVLALALVWALLRRRKPASRPLPTEWSLTARPVFSAEERRVYRLLKDALPHHVILAKLPLVRFCQPTEAREVHYWFELLGAIHVGFAICSPNGRVLAAIDIDTERSGGNSSSASRSLKIKQSVLAACRVRYLRCPIDKLPSAAELQLLVPYSNSASRGPQAAPAPGMTQAQPLRNAPSRRAAAARNSLWQDSALFNDSFFAPDSRYDSATGGRSSGYYASQLFAEGALGTTQYPDEAPNDIVGVVVDSPRYAGRPQR